MVKGIQSEAIVNMRYRRKGAAPCRAQRARSTLHQAATSSATPPTIRTIPISSRAERGCLNE